MQNRPGNQGVSIASMCQALKQYGVCYETAWPYDFKKIDTAPTQSADDQAINFKIIDFDFNTISNNADTDVLTNIKTMLSRGIPVLMRIPEHSSLRALSGPWTTHSWNIVTSDANPINSYHAVLIIGYDDASQRLLIENSWGPGFGDGGFFGFPYSYIDQSSGFTTLNIGEDGVAWANKTPYVAPKPLRNYNPYYFIGVIVLSIVLVVGSRFIK